MIYSFNEIILAKWSDLTDKEFTRIDTNEHVGQVYAKYGADASLSASFTRGRIEFINSNTDNIVRVFGEDIDVTLPLFQSVEQQI